MIPARLVPYVMRQLTRQRMRSLLTASGVAVGMFLFVTITCLEAGVKAATRESARDTTLVVYREDRYCPFTSRLPEHYTERIRRIDGVTSVLPMKVTVSNCRTSLDVVTFRGVPVDETVAEFTKSNRAPAAALDAWAKRTDAALIGAALARRRGLGEGDRFDANGLTVTVAGIMTSDEPQDENVAYVHLPFLQYAPGVSQAGIVTQFNVRVREPEMLKSVALAIDAEFERDQEPTATYSEKAFVARAAGDLLGLVEFARYLGYGCIIAVLALVANTIVLAARDRVREHAVLETLGYPSSMIARLLLTEGALLSIAGGATGTFLASILLALGGYSLSTEGLSITFSPSIATMAVGLIASAVLGVLASLAPAWMASRQEIVPSFRAV